jgi:Xaa-Pro aminopeptidase
LRRINALREVALKENGFRGYVVFNSSNLLYFLGFPGASALLVLADGEATIYVYGVNYQQAKTETESSRIELVTSGEDLMKKITQQAQKHMVKNLAIDTLGIENWRILAKQARSRMKLKVKPTFVSQLRAVKDEEEIILLRKAAQLTSLGMKTAYEVLSPGMKEIEVAAEIEYAMRKHGSYGTAFDTAVSSGPASAFPHGGCGDHEIRSGELVVIDFGAVYRSYRSDMTRTLVAGKSSERQQKIHAVVKKAQEKAFAAIRPNAKASDVHVAARKVIEEAGYGEFFVHGLGHGVGLDIHEPPTLNSTSKETLKVGNVVTDEPGIYLVGYGGVRLEDTVQVTKEGADKLTIGPYGLCRE